MSRGSFLALAALPAVQFRSMPAVREISGVRELSVVREISTGWTVTYRLSVVRELSALSVTCRLPGRRKVPTGNPNGTAGAARLAGCRPVAVAHRDEAGWLRSVGPRLCDGRQGGSAATPCIVRSGAGWPGEVG